MNLKVLLCGCALVVSSTCSYAGDNSKDEEVGKIHSITKATSKYMDPAPPPDDVDESTTKDEPINNAEIVALNSRLAGALEELDLSPNLTELHQAVIDAHKNPEKQSVRDASNNLLGAINIIICQAMRAKEIFNIIMENHSKQTFARDDYSGGMIEEEGFTRLLFDLLANARAGTQPQANAPRIESLSSDAEEEKGDAEDRNESNTSGQEETPEEAQEDETHTPLTPTVAKKADNLDRTGSSTPTSPTKESGVPAPILEF